MATIESGETVTVASGTTQEYDGTVTNAGTLETQGTVENVAHAVTATISTTTTLSQTTAATDLLTTTVSATATATTTQTATVTPTALLSGSVTQGYTTLSTYSQVIYEPIIRATERTLTRDIKATERELAVNGN